MSEQENQSPVPPKNRRVLRIKAERRNHPTQQFEAALPVLPPVPLSLTSSIEPPIGEMWGEFPPAERQAELKKRMEEWERKPNHVDLPGPFAGAKLSGADVYWFAALEAGAGEAIAGKRALDELPPPALARLHLKGADLSGAQLKGAFLAEAQLEGADLSKAQLEGAKLIAAQLEGADLSEAQLGGARLIAARLEGAKLIAAQLDGARLIGAQLKGARLIGAQLKGAKLSEAQLNGADLSEAQLDGADLSEAQLDGADLSGAQLKGADLSGAQLEGANLRRANLTHQVNLREATFDVKTQLAEAVLDPTLQVADALWNGVPLIRVPWGQVLRLGDEAVARQAQTGLEKRLSIRKGVGQRLEEFEAAARAYRQLAIALRSQGITEAADRFAYRALLMQRKALWWQLRQKKLSKLGSYLFSLFLDVLTGYGFRMGRIIFVYALVITTFASAYYILSTFCSPAIPWNDAFVLSITAFHGRVFSSPFMLGSPQGWVTALEAVFGLVIEGVFIAMLTQRFFNR